MFLAPFRLTGKTVEQLSSQARPLTGQPEVVPWYFFHRRTYIAAGPTQLVFFDAVENDPGLGNLELAGQIPTPQFAEIFSFHFDVLAPLSNAADADPPVGGAADTEIIRRSGLGVFQFELSQKVYGHFPLNAIGPSGNPLAVIAGIDNVAAGGTPSIAQAAGWIAHFSAADPDPIITIPPTTGFRARTRWNVAAPISADTLVEVGLWAKLHRKVV